MTRAGPQRLAIVAISAVGVSCCRPDALLRTPDQKVKSKGHRTTCNIMSSELRAWPLRESRPQQLILAERWCGHSSLSRAVHSRLVLVSNQRTMMAHGTKGRRRTGACDNKWLCWSRAKVTVELILPGEIQSQIDAFTP
jgi:hypothetical protein